MNNWHYYDLQGNKKGPVDWDTLRQLAKNRKIFSNTRIVTPDGQTKPAQKVDGLDFPAATQTPQKEKFNLSVSSILESFRKTDYRKEVLPLNAHSTVVLLKDPTFWVIFTLGALPLAIASFNHLAVGLYGLYFFFAFVWGGIFRGLVLKTSDNLLLPIVAFFTTGIVGVAMLLAFHECLPSFYLNMPDHSNPIIQLFGCIFQTGLWEEICKILPVILYLIWKREHAQPMMMVLIGVFSGLGFAAFENVHYAVMKGVMGGLENIDVALGNILSAENEAEFQGAMETAAIATFLHNSSIMIMALLRAVSCTFGHAIWTGIFAYYLACAMASRKQWVVFCCLGLLVPMVLHGTYNWLCGLQPGYAALIVGISFVLFYSYLMKLRRQLE